MEKVFRCNECGCVLGETAVGNMFGGSFCSNECSESDKHRRLYVELGKGERVLTPHGETVLRPAHYHQYNMDTIGFLREGFPPDVLRGFLIGNIIKYTQRYQLKNGIEDLDKALNYMQILRKEELKNHS